MTTLCELEELAADEAQPFATRRIAEALASAINDWPTCNLTSLNAYIVELRSEVGDALTLTNVRAMLKSYAILGEVWKAESICGLLGAWDSAVGDVVLDDLVKRIGLDI